MSYNAVRSVIDRSKAKGSARLLLVILAEHLNKETRRCDPSVATLAREANTTPRTVARLLAELKAAGEIEITTGGGRNHCNSYTIAAAENPDTAVTFSTANPDTRDSVSSSNTLTPVTGFDGETLTNQVRNPDNVVRRTIRNQKDIFHAGEDSDFTAFWSAYPRKVAKPAALKAWRSAKHRPPLADLLAALDRHKGSEQWQSDRFIPYPATWINQQRWEDELPPAEKPKPLLVRL
jgi:hypothetical protein